jgi:tetratricopeptide (TPR) repeat protein
MTLRLAALCVLITLRTAAADPPKPAITADAALSIQDLSKPVRATDEQVLVELIASTPDSDADKSALYFRLGTFYAARYHATKTKTDLLKAVKVFKALTANDAFRNFSQLDVALFYYGYTLQTGLYMKEARAVYDQLLKNYPNSKYVPEAHLAFAEYYFDGGQLDDAEARYKMVLKFPKSSAYWYAMYKMGWVHLDRQRFQEALETFFQVAQAAKHDAALAALDREAKLDFVRAYVEIGKPDKAYATFQRVDGAAAQDMLERLAELDVEHGKLADATAVYRQLLKLAPANANACRWQAAVVRAAAGTPDEAKVTGALAATTQCADLLSPDEKQRIAKSAIQGWQTQLPADVQLAAPPKKLPIAEPIPAAELTMLANLDRYADQLSADERAQLKLVKAAIYRKHAHHGEAIAILNDIIAHDRDRAVAERAADLWLDSLLQLHRFDTALEVVDALAADKTFVDGKPMLARNIQFLRAGSLR